MQDDSEQDWDHFISNKQVAQSTCLTSYCKGNERS